MEKEEFEEQKQLIFEREKNIEKVLDEKEIEINELENNIKIYQENTITQ
ncbi:TPA: hypothetical protein KSK42_003175 [Clostridioides difficile]|nr:hypothetical protein [Clostridioides difficile]